MLNACGHVDVDPAQGVGHRLEAFEVDDGHVVQPGVEHPLQGLHHQRDAAQAMAEFILASPWPGISTHVSRMMDIM